MHQRKELRGLYQDLKDVLQTGNKINDKRNLYWKCLQNKNKDNNQEMNMWKLSDHIDK